MYVEIEGETGSKEGKKSVFYVKQAWQELEKLYLNCVYFSHFSTALSFLMLVFPGWMPTLPTPAALVMGVVLAAPLTGGCNSGDQK
jgi:hypothetical protein